MAALVRNLLMFLLIMVVFIGDSHRLMPEEAPVAV
jgi:hypothetical protein